MARLQSSWAAPRAGPGYIFNHMVNYYSVGKQCQAGRRILAIEPISSGTLLLAVAPCLNGGPGEHIGTTRRAPTNGRISLLIHEAVPDAVLGRGGPWRMRSVSTAAPPHTSTTLIAPLDIK